MGVAIALGVVAAGAAAYSAANAKKLYGTKPSVPAAPTVSGILGDTIASDTAALPGASRLASGVNAANQNELMKNFRNTLGPGALDDIKSITANLGKQAKGEFPDLARSTFDMGAVSAAQGGYQGSGMDAAGRFRNYGLKQYEETNKAIGSYLQWITGAKSLLMTPETSAASFLATPGMAQSVANQEFSRNTYAANVAAAPDPGTVGTFNSAMGMITTLGTIYAAQKKKEDEGSDKNPWLGTGAANTAAGDKVINSWNFGWNSGLK